MALDLPGPCRLYLGTADGLRTARFDADGVEVTAAVVADETVRAIAVHPDDPDDAFVGCGLRGWGLFRTRDGGETVDALGFEDKWVWGIGRHPLDPETVYIGTEPPMVYRSADGGQTFTACSGLEELPSRDDWTFFHEPFRAGHVHGFAHHPERPDRLIAGVEQGALVRSTDGGETWHESLAGGDVHRVAVDPDDPDRVYAATGSGLYRSDDGGETWTPLDGLNGYYCHATVFDPQETDRMYVYVADEASPLYRSEDGGDTWEPIAESLPDARPADTVRLHPDDPDTLVYSGDPDWEASRLFVSTDGGDRWERIAGTLPKTWRLEAVPEPGV